MKFLCSIWVWGTLILVLGFRLGLSLVPQRASAQAPPAPPVSAAPPLVPLVTDPGAAGAQFRTLPRRHLDPSMNPRMDFSWVKLPCGHPVDRALVGGGAESYTCTQGHSFDRRGNQWLWLAN
jgi:hypothetical protein